MNASPPECGTCLQWWETGVVTVWLKWRHVCFMDLGESPPLIEFADVLSRRGTPAYFPEPLLPGAGRGRQGGAGIGGKGAARPPPAPRSPPHVPTHLDGRELEAHDDAGEPEHGPVHCEGGREGCRKISVLTTEGTGPGGRERRTRGAERGAEGPLVCSGWPREEVHISPPGCAHS